MTAISDSRSILGTRVDVPTLAAATAHILDRARAGESGYIVAANVHVVMEGHDSAAFSQVVNGAALVTPDGMPLVWALRLLGIRAAVRVDGPSLTLAVCAAAAQANVPLALYGGRPETLAAFTAAIQRRVPGLRVVCAIAPPFRPLTAAEDAADTQRIIDSGARLVLVCLGCPRQENWCAAHQGRIPAMMIAVGAALDFYAGRLPRAPVWLQTTGLEWLFRLLHEPRRLLPRYLRHNPRFVGLVLRQWSRERRARQGANA